MDTIPPEILEEILLYLDVQSIIRFSMIGKQSPNILREKLELTTRFKLKDYTREELIHLSKIKYPKYLSAGFEHSLIYDGGGKVYHLKDGHWSVSSVCEFVQI